MPIATAPETAVARSAGRTAPSATNAVPHIMAGMVQASAPAANRATSTAPSHCSPYRSRIAGRARNRVPSAKDQPSRVTVAVTLRKGCAILPFARDSRANQDDATEERPCSISWWNMATKPFARENKPAAAMPCSFPSSNSGALPHRVLMSEAPVVCEPKASTLRISLRPGIQGNHFGRKDTAPSAFTRIEAKDPIARLIGPKPRQAKKIETIAPAKVAQNRTSANSAKRISRICQA